MEVVVYANYIGLRRFYRYVVNIGRWSPYEGGQLDRFYCINKLCNVTSCWTYLYIRILLGAQYILHISRIRVDLVW
jgi:hypothetical protein